MAYKEKKWAEKEIKGKAPTIPILYPEEPKDEKTDDQTTEAGTGNGESGGETDGGGVGYQFSQEFKDATGGGSVDFTVGDGIQAAKEKVDAAKDGVEEESGRYAAGVQEMYADFYNQYKRKYMDAADKNYRGADSDAALLTGGYGNSYGAYMGKEAYDDTMSAFYASAPGLYEAAEGFYEQGAGGKAFADAQAALDSAEGDLTTAIKEEQTRAAEKYFSEYQKGNMSLDAVKAALAGLVAYTDSDGNAVNLFTEEEINVLAEAFAQEMEGQKTGKETAIEKEQASAFEHYLDLIAAGKMTWEEAAEAMDGLTYTDADGNTVDFFTEEDMKKWESEYNDIVAKQEAAWNTFELELMEMLEKYPERANTEYLTRYFKDKGYVPNEATIKGYVDAYAKVDEDWKTPTGDMWKKAEDLYNSYRFDDLETYASNLRKAGYDTSFIEALYDEGKEIFRTSDIVKNIIGRDYKQQKDGWNWWGGADTDDVFSYNNIEGKGNRELVNVTVDEIIDELVDAGVPKADAVAWILANLPGA